MIERDISSYNNEKPDILKLNKDISMAQKQVIEHYRKIKLFGFLPLYGRIQRGGKKSWRIFGLPIFTIRRFENNITTKYYILGLPIMKVSKKQI